MIQRLLYYRFMGDDTMLLIALKELHRANHITSH